MWLVDSNYSFECDYWLIELSNNKLSGNNLVSILVENKNIKPITIEEIATFMIIIKINCPIEHFYMCVFRRVGISDNTMIYKTMMIMSPQRMEWLEKCFDLWGTNEAINTNMNTMEDS